MYPVHRRLRCILFTGGTVYLACAVHIQQALVYDL